MPTIHWPSHSYSRFLCTRLLGDICRWQDLLQIPLEGVLYFNRTQGWDTKAALGSLRWLERVRGVEPLTFSLGSWRATAELLPHRAVIHSLIGITLISSWDIVKICADSLFGSPSRPAIIMPESLNNPTPNRYSARFFRTKYSWWSLATYTCRKIYHFLFNWFGRQINIDR